MVPDKAASAILCLLNPSLAIRLCSSCMAWIKPITFRLQTLRFSHYTTFTAIGWMGDWLWCVQFMTNMWFLIFAFYFKSATQVILIIHLNDKQISERGFNKDHLQHHFFISCDFQSGLWTVIHFFSPSIQQCEWWICLSPAPRGRIIVLVLGLLLFTGLQTTLMQSHCN